MIHTFKSYALTGLFVAAAMITAGVANAQITTLQDCPIKTMCDLGTLRSDNTGDSVANAVSAERVSHRGDST